MNRSPSSPALRAPSPPLGAEERDGERRFMGRRGEGRTRVWFGFGFTVEK
jgi:hypothetical protein